MGQALVTIVEKLERVPNAPATGNQYGSTPLGDDCADDECCRSQT